MKSIQTCAVCLSTIVLAHCAPITGAFEGSTETFENTTEASVGLTSSTSPRSDSSSTAKNRRSMAVQFAQVNFDKVRRDISRGEGEYVRTLGDLLAAERSSDSISAFVDRAHKHYAELYEGEESNAREASGEVLVSRLENLIS